MGPCKQEKVRLLRPAAQVISAAGNFKTGTSADPYILNPPWAVCKQVATALTFLGIMDCKLSAQPYHTLLSPDRLLNDFVD
jgi:hypothetical protein